MPAKSVEALFQAYKVAKDHMDANRHVYEDALDLVNPFRETFSQHGDSMPTPKTQFDSTAQIAAANFVNTMVNDFTPPFEKWALLKTGPGLPAEQKPAADKILEQINDIIFTYIHSSNFQTIAPQMYWDLGLGTGCTFILETNEENPLRFANAPISDLAIMEGREGKVDMVFKEIDLLANALPSHWGLDAKFSEETKEKIGSRPFEKVRFIEATYYDYKTFSWFYDVIEKKTKHKVLTRQYGEGIAVVPRWMRIPGYWLGVGPFIMALADARTLNTMKEFSLHSGALSTFGAYTVSGNQALNTNNWDIGPMAFLPVERNGGPNGPSILPLPQVGNFQAQEFLMNNLVDQIKQSMFDQRVPESAQPKTAFEFAERLKELQSNIGAAFGPLYYDFVQPMMRRVVDILARRGKFDTVQTSNPELLRNLARLIDNRNIQVQITSPIAQSQGAGEVNKFVQAFTILQQVNPEIAMLSIDTMKLPDWIFDKLGASPSILRPEEERQKIRQQIEQAAQTAANVELQQRQGQIQGPQQ